MTEFDQLVDQHYASLYRFALSLSRSPDQALDLVQQTFLIWAEKGHTLKNRKKVKSWLFTTLYRDFLKTVRKRNREDQLCPGELEVHLPAVPPAVVQKLDGDAAVEALQSVDEPYRSALTLFYLRDHSYAEIAEILGIPAGTVMSRIYRGKQMLIQYVLDRDAMTASGSLHVMKGQHHG